MNKLIIITISFLLFSCNQGTVIDTGDWSGTINANSDESKIITKLSKSYVDGNFEIADEYLADDAVNTVNGVVYSKEEWIAGYKRDHDIFDNIQQNDLNITTMYYNNGRIFTNHWLTWSGTSKITGETNTAEYYGYWEWKDGKVIATGGILDPTWYGAEIMRYLETQN
jgi:hypothetical protein